MDEIKPQVNTTPAPVTAKPATSAPATAQRPFERRRFGGGSNNRQGGRKPFERKKEEFAEKVVDMRRVTRVMAGGKRFRFRCTIILGDHKGRVGIGMGKGVDVQTAVMKAKHQAKKNMIVINLNKRTIPHQVEAKFSAARVLLKPAKEGNGLVAGGAVRAVLMLVGVKDITAKCLGTTANKVTNALATVEALKMLKPMRTGKNNAKPESEVKTPAVTA